MQKVTLKYIGAVSLGKLLAIWTFVLGLISLVLYTLITGVMALLGLAAGTDVAQTLGGAVILLFMGVISLVGAAVAMFIFGFVSAMVYNVILGVGGGIDLDFSERSG
ncbi:hypothetical protein JW721_01885 [Candidatus Micrarchaeota archaeon]|nr:hypothetical protein [Candidatus Micrarchaeota archaeon]